MMDKITVDGHEFTKADVVALRDEVIQWRDRSFKNWPAEIEDTLTTTYLIGFLAGVLDQYPPGSSMAADPSGGWVSGSCSSGSSSSDSGSSGGGSN